jgi:hypothetical protein
MSKYQINFLNLTKFPINMETDMGNGIFINCYDENNPNIVLIESDSGIWHINRLFDFTSEANNVWYNTFEMNEEIPYYIGKITIEDCLIKLESNVDKYINFSIEYMANENLIKLSLIE